MKHAADLCTLLRVALAPVFAWTVTAATGAPSAWPALIYALAAASDFLDGRLARAAGTATAGGRAFDHGADALLLFPALAILAGAARVPALLPVAATAAFALYLADGWRHGAPGARLVLTPSRFGAIAGVANYAIAGFAVLALAGADGRLDALVWGAGGLAGALNLLACLERTRMLAAPALSSCAPRG